jgi:hypothetical protein
MRRAERWRCAPVALALALLLVAECQGQVFLSTLRVGAVLPLSATDNGNMRHVARGEIDADADVAAPAPRCIVTAAHCSNLVAGCLWMCGGVSVLAPSALRRASCAAPLHASATAARRCRPRPCGVLNVLLLCWLCLRSVIKVWEAQANKLFNFNGIHVEDMTGRHLSRGLHHRTDGMRAPCAHLAPSHPTTEQVQTSSSASTRLWRTTAGPLPLRRSARDTCWTPCECTR